MGIIGKFVTKLFGSYNERFINSLNSIVVEINDFESEFKSLKDTELQDKTQFFKDRLTKGESLESILPEAFATMREASRRVINLRHYDVQLIGGIVLHRGSIAEMGTGEGKTLVATLPTYLHALEGKGVHIVTVNDYLAKRDAEWMGKAFNFLGMDVGVVVSNMDLRARQAVYKCDIIYATNNELGFDYLRDNMASTIEQKVQRGLEFAIVDEVDSILIDEARTPLVISGAADDHSHVYYTVNKIIPSFIKQVESGIGKEIIVEIAGDYTVDEKDKQVLLTDEGHVKAEQALIDSDLLKEGSSLYEPSNIMLIHHLTSALRAHVLYQKNVDYIVFADEVVIIDEFTGRKMTGRRWAEGLHQAIEAKENVTIKKENQTLASITFQNYFRLYKTLSGMTGTAYTEAVELQNIYNLEVVVVPPNKISVRVDEADKVYLTAKEKFNAIINDIKDCQKKGQPVLVGTSSIESSELVSNLLIANKIKHNVLNAKQHEKEAQIIADAGALKVVTIATNMAGRGTDIVLGGSLDEEQKQMWEQRRMAVISAGGLHVIGTERNESRRVDNQLRGRSGRQGDIGSTRFYLSLEDNLMRIFASEKMAMIMQKLGMKSDEAIEHKMVGRAIENAQKKVEAMNYDTRKNLLEYDNVSSEQRNAIYEFRNGLIAQSDVSTRLAFIRKKVIINVVAEYVSLKKAEENWDVEGLSNALKTNYMADLPIRKWLDEGMEVDEFEQKIITELVKIFNYKEKIVGAKAMCEFEKAVMLQTLDKHWKEHLAAMDHLRREVGLRHYAQKSPTQEYKNESFTLFSLLLKEINIEIIKIISSVKVDKYVDMPAIKNTTYDNIEYQHSQSKTLNIDNSFKEKKQANLKGGFNQHKNVKKIGRNTLCPCGSGKKYKYCHG